MQNKMYQVSTLQALALGYSRAVINAGELLQEGDTGLGTFEDVNGEMIVMCGHAAGEIKTDLLQRLLRIRMFPFAAVAKLHGDQQFTLDNMPDITSITNRAYKEDRREIWPEQYAYCKDRR